MIFDNQQLEFTPHPLAPTFSKESNPQLVLAQLATELSSSNPQTPAQVIALLREAGFVSLWFYLKYILGASGPYDKLNEGVHLAMCNFRQRVAITPGIKAGVFTPRSLFKSTINTHGACTWELLRDPNLRIAITSSIFDRAFAFTQQVIANISENELHKALYPEWAKANRSNDELVLRNRTKRFVEPSVMPMTAGGSTQGVHVDLFIPDDIVGEDMLNADHAATADMIRMGNWLHTNLRTLVVDWNQSRVLAVGTRYGLEDPYERIMLHSKEQLGHWDELDYEVDPTGEWTTFYVPAIIAGESINPEAFTVEQLTALSIDDPWTYQSQYANNPKAAKIGDLAGYMPKDCILEWDEENHDWNIHIDDVHGIETVPLRQCDVVIAADPAASDGRPGQRNSRCAVVVAARDLKKRTFLLEAKASFWPTLEFFGQIFTLWRKFPRVIRATYFEAQGAFKSLLSPLREEQRRQKIQINLQPTPALGQKETTIRNLLQPELEKGLFYVSKEARLAFVDELRSFPGRRMDLLDATKIAVAKLHTPDPRDEDDEDDEPGSRRGSRRQAVSATTGY